MTKSLSGLPRWCSGKESPANAGDTGGSGIPGISLGRGDTLEEKTATTPVFLPGGSYRQRSLEDCNSWGHKALDAME